MINRHILQTLLLSGSGRRWVSCSYSAHALTVSPSPCSRSTEFHGLSPHGCIFEQPTTPLYPSYKRCIHETFSTHSLLEDNDKLGGKIVDVPLAQTGEGIAECELLKWFVQEGDDVDEFQPLCEVQSDKATMEITSRYKGKVTQILHLPGGIVKVGETLLKMIVEEPVGTLPSGKVVESETDDLIDKKNEGVLSTPAVRNLAKQYGVNINDINGTGNDGRILKEDIVKYVNNQEETIREVIDSPVLEKKHLHHDFQDKTFPLRGYHRAMAKSMSLAATIPHFHYVEDIICDALLELKASFQNENSDPELKYTLLPVLIKSLSMALNKFPSLNSCFDERMQNVTLKGSHNVGIAMATEHGLVVPNIKRVQSLSILEVNSSYPLIYALILKYNRSLTFEQITKELSRLQRLAGSNKLSQDDISGGTITLSNIGAIGGKFGSPLVNVPEVSIIAIGRAKKVPHFDEDGRVYPATVMTINIGADHRVLDGATVARFCNEWKLLIEKPELLLLNMK